MPKRKRSRGHDSPYNSKMSNGSWRLMEDNVLRDFSDETSLNRTPEAPRKYSPRLLVMDLDSHTGSFVSEQNGKGSGNSPRINHDSLLELDYQMEPLCSPVSGYETPMKRMRPNSTMPVFVKRVQNLNNLQNEKVQNCSRAFNSDSLKRLQNFNELILNTTQSIDYDNCKQLREVEVNLQEDVNLGKVHAELSGTEVSFFTLQLYNGKSASTPIDKKLPKKIEIVQVNTSTSTQFMHIDKVIQTSAQPTPVKRKSKDKVLPVLVSKKRSYKSLPPAIVIVERSGRVDSTTRMFSKIRKYHGRYSSKLPEKFFNMCTWLGLTVIKSFFSLYQLYIEQKQADAPDRSSNHASCSSCIVNGFQMASLTASIDNLRVEIAHMRQENRSSNETVSQLHSELDLIKRQLHNIKDRITSQPLMPPRGVPPPPPPPPPPPVLVPSAPLITNKPKSQAKKQMNENAPPIISLNDILNVKLRLRKTCELSTAARRATDPLISSSLKLMLRQTSLPETLSSATPSSPSSLSEQPSLQLDANP